ncbi:sugar-transfer associated ATP-grasp domain-containing protein [Patescibacteria group bacterium]
MRAQDVLGMNARNHEYLKYNTRSGKKIANSKLLTKSTMRKLKIPVPRLFKVFRDRSELDKYDFTRLSDSFVVKPNNGLGGEGIIVVERGGLYAGEWITSSGDKIDVQDIKLHIEDIIEGRFSMDDTADFAFVEERVKIHPVFEKYAYHGTPDVRVIVFNKIPVMAMLRIPTKESGGRANLHQGAVGAGIDLATGITTHAIVYANEVAFMPDSRRRVRGIQIPEWDKVLELSIMASEASGLAFVGADVVLQPSTKYPGKTLPKILEINAQPGLKIQLCNKAGLRSRLRRVEGLEVESPKHGISIGKTLFGEKDMKHLSTKKKKIKVFEEVEVVNQLKEKVLVKVKVDTGAFRTSIDQALAEELGLLRSDNIVMQKEYESALGQTTRDVIRIVFYLAGKRIETTASVADRSKLKRPFLVGRRDLKGFQIVFD